jgi:methyl-accepting chemotaxis protein
MPVSVYTGLRNQAIAFALVVGAVVLAAGIGVTIWRNRDIGRRIERLVRDGENARAASEARTAELKTHCDGFDGDVRCGLDRVNDLTEQLDATAATLAEAASVSQEQSTTMASAAEEANVCTAGVAEAMSKMADRIRDSVRRNEETRALTGAASGAAGDCRERVTGMTAAVGRIGEAVSLIESIADQTNLLALNATIEAARAGDAGRGFAVVAGEVKALAGQTARTTDEITAHISAIHTAAGGVAEAIEKMAGAIGQVDEAAGAINEQMDAELTESREVTARMDEAARGVAEITAGIEQASTRAADTADGAARINGVARDVSGESRELRRRVEAFLAAVRAA